MTGTAARPTAGRAFFAILWRDVFVTGRELPMFLAQVAIQPLFILFVFAEVLGRAGYVSDEYGHLLLPGIVALTTFLTALQTVSFPLVIEFGWTKEIEDRLLAPLPTYLVAYEKILIAMLRGIVSAIVMYPVGAFVLGSAPWHSAGIPMLVLFLILGGWVGGAIGLTLGTVVKPHQVNVMLTLVHVPLMFTGATQYPWTSLDSLRWFQVVTAFNPLTYLSEGVRAAVVPEIPHIAPSICVAALLASAAIFTAIGTKGFLRRAID
jgi:ABC-2 type transport system permease protein